ncbi:unnamed protein product, partial [Cuscuta europaea]
MNSTAPIPRKVFVDGSSCKLAVESQTEDGHKDLKYVAMALAYNTALGAMIHNIPMSANTIKVNISMIYTGFEQCPLLVPNVNADIYVLTDAIGSFVEWPSHLVFFEGEDQVKSKRKDVIQKNKAFIPRESPRVVVPPSTYPLVSDTILQSLTEDLLELHEMLEWYEPEVCKFSIALLVNAFHYPQNSEFGTIIDRKDLTELLEGDSVDMCIIQSFALCALAKLNDLQRDDVVFLCPLLCSYGSYQLDKKGTITYMKQSLCATFGKRMILLPYNEGFHWILIVICPSVNKDYIFNSIPSFSNISIQKDLALAYRVTSARNG